MNYLAHALLIALLLGVGTSCVRVPNYESRYIVIRSQISGFLFISDDKQLIEDILSNINNDECIYKGPLYRHIPVELLLVGSNLSHKYSLGPYYYRKVNHNEDIFTSKSEARPYRQPDSMNAIIKAISCIGDAEIDNEMREKCFSSSIGYL